MIPGRASKEFVELGHKVHKPLEFIQVSNTCNYKIITIKPRFKYLTIDNSFLKITLIYFTLC